MKYIMFEIGDVDLKILVPVIFPNVLVHSLVSKYFKECLEHHGMRSVPVSAGDCQVFGTEITCSGKSETLRLKAREGDAAVIHNHDYLMGIENPEMEDALKSALRKEKK